MDQVELAAVQRQERLEAELHGHKTNLIKESIRQSHNALGDFFYSRGDLQVGAWEGGACVYEVVVVWCGGGGGTASQPSSHCAVLHLLRGTVVLQMHS